MKLYGTTIFDKKYIEQNASRWLANVKFPKLLEADYQTKYCKAATYEFRYRAPIILVLYLFLCVGIAQVLPNDQMQKWLYYYASVGIIITSAWLLSFIERFEQYFDWYVGIGSGLGIAISFILVTLTDNGQSNILFHVAMMYAVIITYAFVGLRVYTITFAGWFGGAIAILVVLHLQHSIEWTVLNRTYTFSSFLGMAIAYAIDRQHRESYLQNCIIALNNLELIEQAQRLSILSRQDALTGLANRRYLDEVLGLEWNRALRTQTSLCIMMVDIDFFKRYNDSLGHIEGDKCLKRIANIIALMTSRTGELAARYGGEEFFLLFPTTSEKDAKALIERLMNAIREHHIVHPDSDIASYVTISAGIAITTPSLSCNISDFISQADNALYLAKINGRNQYNLVINQIGVMKQRRII
ncbi:GGDEF domain-containing protein [Acinetobacter sp. MD2]|uniref:GGDEF domain-containing protein n=1 Tax=Acinetobacter sp. MD2 TaxID=2600066 RepID=UPI002D1F8280|nr:GGDEF domain-containing protein [Acinetobacter sp. MD2]MEB3768078.1 GGDEF domain-containing protein [Acinetobacter sp. MD2]